MAAKIKKKHLFDKSQMNKSYYYHKNQMNNQLFLEKHQGKCATTLQHLVQKEDITFLPPAPSSPAPRVEGNRERGFYGRRRKR